MSATLSVVAVVSATLSVVAVVSATLSVVAVVSAALSVAADVSATLSVVAVVSAALSVVAVVSATLSVVAVVSATLSVACDTVTPVLLVLSALTLVVETPNITAEKIPAVTNSFPDLYNFLRSHIILLSLMKFSLTSYSYRKVLIKMSNLYHFIL